jgi:hypothetical protein
MQGFLVIDFLQEFSDGGPRVFEIAVLGAIDFLILQGFDEALARALS